MKQRCHKLAPSSFLMLFDLVKLLASDFICLTIEVRSQGGMC